MHVCIQPDKLQPKSEVILSLSLLESESPPMVSCYTWSPEAA